MTRHTPDDETLRDSGQTDFATILHTLWHRRWLFVIGPGIAVVLTIVYLQLSTYKHTAQLQVTPVEAEGRESLSGALGSLRGLASIAGISLPTGRGSSEFQLYVESLRTRDVADRLAQRKDLMRVIFASEWDASAQRWVRPPRRFAGLRSVVRTILGMPRSEWQPPGGARLQEYLAIVIKVEQNPKTPVVTIRMDHKDPAFGVRLLAGLHEAADGQLRAKALARADEYVRYLSQKLNTVTVSEHRMALAQALSEQEKIRMMSSATTPFAAEPFGAPAASLRPTRPLPFRVLAVAVLLGTFVGVLAALYVPGFSRRSR